MKNPTRLVILLLGLLFITACKKGKDDPAISFLSRKARLTGDWKMQKGTVSVTYNDVNGVPLNDYYVFDGSNLTLNTTESGRPVIYTGKYLLSMSFKKDGSFTLSEMLGISVLNASGTWNFISGVGQTKNKESILMYITSVTGAATTQHLFNKTNTEFTYKLTELRNKEIAMEASNVLYSNGVDDQTTYRSVYTLVAD